jgi:hypothetical protein
MGLRQPGLVRAGFRRAGASGGGGGGGLNGPPPAIAATSSAGVALTGSRSDHTHQGALESGGYTAPLALQTSGLVVQTVVGSTATLGIAAMVINRVPFGNSSGSLQVNSNFAVSTSGGLVALIIGGGAGNATTGNLFLKGTNASTAQAGIFINQTDSTGAGFIAFQNDRAGPVGLGYISYTGSTSTDPAGHNALVIGNPPTAPLGSGGVEGDVVISNGANGQLAGPMARFFSDAHFQLFGDTGGGAGLSAAGTGAFRYHTASNTMQLSVNGGAYADLGAGLTAIPDQTFLANISGGAAVPTSTTVAQGQTLFGIQPSNNVAITGGAISGTTINLLGAFATGVVGVTTGTGALTTMALVGLHITTGPLTLNNDVVTGIAGNANWVGSTSANGHVFIVGTNNATSTTAYVGIGNSGAFLVKDNGFVSINNGSLPAHPIDIGTTGSVSVQFVGNGANAIETASTTGNLQLGTLHAIPLIFYTNNTNQLAISATGVITAPQASPTFTFDPTVPGLTLVGSGGLTESPLHITVGDTNGNAIHLTGGATTILGATSLDYRSVAGTVSLSPNGVTVVQGDQNANLALGFQAALANNATNGWPYMRNSPAAPTGVPTLPFTGMNPFQYDETNHKFWIYDRGAAAWKGIVLL